MPKVSICIAVYNVEKYIEQCVRSLFEQTLDDLEYIFVDDASTDASIDVMLRVLEDYPHRKNQVKLLRHETNLGVAVTRKDAIAAAIGDYVIHCDPDDWVELDMYEKIYTAAVDSGADLTICRYYVERIGNTDTSCEVLNNGDDFVEMLLKGKVYCSLYNQLYKRHIVKHKSIKYDDSLRVAEDWMEVVQLLNLSKTVCCIENVLYHYRTFNEKSLTKTYHPRCLVSAITQLGDIVEKKKYRSSLDRLKIIALMHCMFSDEISAREWHRLWKATKRRVFFISYPVKLKIIFCLACINYPVTKWFWKKVRERRFKINADAQDNNLHSGL